MTAFPLFDHFAASNDSAAPELQERLITVAHNMVSATIQRFEKITELDEGLAPPAEVEDVPFDMETAVALRLMYEDCAKEAERVIARIDNLERRTGRKVANSETLRMWHGKTMAMLAVPVEEIAKGVEEAQQGKLIPVGVIRDELRARSHA